MKPDTKVSIITYAGIVIVLLVLGGVAVFFSIEPVSDCHPDATRLGNPVTETTIRQALSELETLGLVSTVEDALSNITGIAWILDPADDYRLEYWISFGDNTVGFEVTCITTEFAFNWKYDGFQVTAP